MKLLPWGNNTGLKLHAINELSVGPAQADIWNAIFPKLLNYCAIIIIAVLGQFIFKVHQMCFHNYSSKNSGSEVHSHSPVLLELQMSSIWIPGWPYLVLLLHSISHATLCNCLGRRWHMNNVQAFHNSPLRTKMQNVFV